ncbi:MAG: peptidoglycan recognition family protein [Clostridia bacterium]|jgi:N-acetyl-anhydromuramyl-L-alanine amidase AmpD|nr:peptidoglycan recognition family protein [Clostridia bacterium]
MHWKYIIVHHTGAEEKNTAQIRNYHRRLGWRDIGYHFVIERDGILVPGRVQCERGAHCVAGNMNGLALGVALIGNFELRAPNPEQLATLDSLLRRLMAEHRISLTGVLGHGEVNGANTACPGRYLDLRALREGLGNGS